MKLNLEIDLEWIDEEKGLDESVKEQIIKGVVSKIQKQIETKIETRINDTIDKTVVAKINQQTDLLFNDFISRPVTISDNYGSQLKVYDKMEDLIKERFDKFMVQTVDDKGNTYDGSYGTKYTRLVFIIDKQMKEFADKFTKDAVTQVSAEIQKHVKDGLTQKLGSELMKVLKVNEMLKLNEK